ncbi:hypothetical protein OPQ81_004297 [Rhizoctonia solani]|nr:hypothetical protein OPQ81_004297 [Rhizoctonia solani]
MRKLTDPQPIYTVPSDIPDTNVDQPLGQVVPRVGHGQWPSIVFGAATLGAGIYNTEDVLNSPEPLRTVRLALRYGIRAFDTSAYYGTSEIVLGAILRALVGEFPRESYKIATKCGRYGGPAEDFDYSRDTIRKSVERSLKRLGTSYLDVVFLHDTEFVCSPVWPSDPTGNPTKILEDRALSAAWGIDGEDEGRVHGPGDQTIIDAFDELKKMKDEGIIREIGLTGYPLPVLLRLGRLVASKGNPADIIMSYSHSNIQNHSFEAFAPLLLKTGVKQLLTASPFNMGYLTNHTPDWHPAPPEMVSFKDNQLVKLAENWPGGLPNLAMGYALRRKSGVMADIPTVAGFSRTSEVHEAMSVWREVTGGACEPSPYTIVMSRSHSVERESKPPPPVPQTQSELEPPTNSLGGSLTDHFAQTLKKMSEDLPTTEYRSPLNIGGRIQQGLSELTKEVVVPHAGRSAHHHDRHDNHHREREDLYPAETIRPTQRGEGDSITSAEKIRRGWQERQDSSHHRSQSEELSRPPPTAYRSGEGFPWFAGQPGRQGSFRGHRRERSADTPPQGSEFYENSDESGQSSIRLEIHNATPLHTSDSVKSRGRPSLTTRLRSSFQKARVGAARPARERTDLSRSPSPNNRRRSPSPRAWRKPSPHSSIRATDQYSTPRTGGGLPESLPRIESQKMNIDWEGSADNGVQSPPRPPIEAIPTIPDLHTPGMHHENELRMVPIIEPDKPRVIEIHEQPSSHQVEPSQSTDATAVNPPTRHEHHRRYRDGSDDHLVLRNLDGSFHSHGSHAEGPRRFKRLLSLTSKPVPIEGDEGPPGQASPSPARPKMVSTPAALIRSTSLIRTRSRRKESSKHRERVEPDTHVGYESDPWGEGPEIHRDAQGNRIFPQEPKRKTSQKKKPNAHTGPTKIALPMGQVEEFHSVHSNSPTEPQFLDPSGNTRPGSPTRKLSSQSTLQVKPSAPDTKYDGWRRSRAGAPRRPSETLLVSPPSNGNQYADEAPILHDQPLFTADPQGYNQELPGHDDTLSPPHHLPAPSPAHAPDPPPHFYSCTRSFRTPISFPHPRVIWYSILSPAPAAPAPRSHSPVPPIPNVTHPTGDHRSQSPLPSETSVHIHIVHGPRIPSPAPPPVVSASSALASGPPPLLRTSPPRRNTPPPLISTPPPRIVTPPPAMSMPIPVTAPTPVVSSRVIPQRPERLLPAEPIQGPHPNIPPVPARMPSPPAHASPDHTPPIQTPRAHTPNLEDHIQINPADTVPGESHGYEDPRYRPPPNPHSYGEPEVRSPVPDTPSYVLPRQPTPTLTTPGVMLNPPSEATSPTIDRDLSPRSDSPPRSVRIEHQERPPISSMLSNRPMPRHLAGLSESEQQMRQQNRQTGSEMSFVNVEPLTKREKLAASVLREPRYYPDRYRQHMEYPTSTPPPQLPPVDTGSSTTHPRPDTSKELPMWYPREQTARNPVRQPSPQRESRGPRVVHEAWGWRSSPHGIPEEAEEHAPATKPSWHHGPDVVAPHPDMSRGDGMLAPPILPPRPVAVRTPDPDVRSSGEKKRVPKYRIEQDERGHPVLVPEPGYDDRRMDYDANRINELLAQLQNSTAFQSVVTSTSSQIPNQPVDVISSSTAASTSPQLPSSGSTVFDLLSRLNPGASSNSQLPQPVNESSEKSPTLVPVASPGLDLRDRIKKVQETQNQLEQSLYATQQEVMRKHEQRVEYAKNKANIVGIPLSEKENQDLESQLAEDLKKFHTNQVLVSWDAQRTKQQAQLESLGVPCMFVTSDPAALQRQQRVLRILLESLSESEDV